MKSSSAQRSGRARWSTRLPMPKVSPVGARGARAWLAIGVALGTLSACSAGSAQPGPSRDIFDGGADPTEPTQPTKPNGSDDGGVTGDPGGPVLLSVTTNVSRIHEGETVRFVALVTHPAGLSSLVGGKLSTPDGKASYGGFAADQQGTYSLDLTWEQISQVVPASFAGKATEARPFVVEFYDAAGRKARQQLNVDLGCKSNNPAVNGKCEIFSACTPVTPGLTCDDVCAAQQATCSNSCGFAGEAVGLIVTEGACTNTTWIGQDVSFACQMKGGGPDTPAVSVRCCCS